MGRTTVAMLALLLAAGCGRPAEPVASYAWVRLAAVPGRPAAGYFKIAGGDRGARLVSVAAAGVPRVEMHESRMTAGGMMAMDAIAAVDVPAGGAVSFVPGGRHVMLFGVPARVTPGTTLPLTFRFAGGRSATAAAKVIAAGDAGPQ